MQTLFFCDESLPIAVWRVVRFSLVHPRCCAGCRMLSLKHLLGGRETKYE